MTMAHLIEQMAYVGQTPWHGLGNQLTTNQPLEVWAKQAGLDWQIEESPVRFVTNSSGPLGEIRAYPDSKVLYRSDTKAPLSVVGNRFKVVQPEEILEFYRDLTEVSGFELDTAGVLKGGRKMWALARTGQSGVLKGNDQTNAYVLLATACDGTMATTAQFTSIRVVCNNTLAVALKDATATSVKVKHNTAFNPELVKKQLGISVSAWDDFMYRLKTLSERKMKTTEARNYFLKVFTEDVKEGVGKTNERSMARALALYEGEGMGAALASPDGTAYGMLSAVTEFIDHHRRAKTIDHRVDSAWFGTGAAVKNRALEQAMSLVA
jgi:phage/plasmid-like protein (TIGR03299 family)